jgi:uncharacterized protein (TIGR02145 family)
MLYQWNRKKAWSVKPSEVSDWDNTMPTMPTEEVWEKANDPCPKGWRVPTSEEISKLCNKENVSQEEFVVVNGLRCEKFTDKASGNFILLPMPGSRHGNDGKRYRVGNGLYWSNDGYSKYKEAAYMECCERGKPKDIIPNLNFAFCVRCVAESE